MGGVKKLEAEAGVGPASAAVQTSHHHSHDHSHSHSIILMGMLCQFDILHPMKILDPMTQA